jgi:predicted P-loop ATPase
MVRGFNLGPSTALAMLLRDFNPRCLPPWPRAELERTCHNAAAHAQRPWGYLRDAEGGEKGLRHKPSERRRPPESTPEMRDAFRKAKAKRQAQGQQPSDEGAPMPAEQEHDQADKGQDPETTGAPPSWHSELQQDRSGYRKNLANVALILSNDPGWIECLGFDEFSGRIMLLKCPPSHVGLRGDAFPRKWCDADEGRVAVWFQRTWKIEATPELVSQAVVVVAHEHRFHPVRDYLEGLRWDGVPRLARWLTTYLGVRETDYSRAVGAFMLRAAVARIFKPGCKVDTMLVLQGEQGAFKSTAIKTLCGAQWFTDELSDFGSKDAAMQLRGAWFIEAAELSGMMRAELERVKAFFSRAVERYRATYGRHVEDQPRQCVFFGTTNADTYLKDETGNRRFWPVLCGVVGGIDIEGLARDRDQLWAEAVRDIQAGERWHLDKQQDAKALKQALAAQEAVRERDAWETKIQAYLTKRSAVFVTTADLLGDALLLETGRWGTGEQRRVGAIMRGMGWQRRQRGTGAEKEWGYVPPYLAPSGTEAPMPDGPPDASGPIGASGAYGEAKKGSGTDGTDGTDGVQNFPSGTDGGSPGGGAPRPAAESSRLDSQIIGAIGAIGASSQKIDVNQAPIGTDEAPKAPMPPSDSPTPPPVSGVTSSDPDEGGGYRVDSDGLANIEVEP